MGKRIEKAFTRDKGQSSAHHDSDDPNKTPEPHVCTGHFKDDFTELCRRNNMAVIPQVLPRPHRPTTPSQAPLAEESTQKSKGKGKDDKKKIDHPPPEPDPEPELDENGEPIEPPPKTYTTKDKFEYFRPCVQVEMENPDKQDTVTEIYIRGWKIDEPMMTIFKQCWPKMDKLHTINLWNTGLQDDTIELFASFISELANLKKLFIENNAVPGENYHLLLDDESPVQHLSLRYNNITDKGAELLGQALGTTSHQNQKLISLNLTGNKITDAGAVHIATGLRMNRTLLSLSFANNKIGDQGASKLAETLSKFPMTHEEVVERRKLGSDKGDRQKSVSPPPGSRRADSRDRPPSVRSNTHGATSKMGKSASKSKKDTKGKDDKDKTKKDDKAKKDTRSRASVVADAGKTGKKDKKKKTIAPVDSEPTESPEFVNPLLDKTESLDNGIILLYGNRSLISLNLSNNEIGEDGIKELLLAIQYQTSLAEFSHSRPGQMGLMRLCVNKNKVSTSNEHFQRLNLLMVNKDPLHKPTASSPDQESQG